MISFIKGSKYREILRNQNEFQSIQPNGQLLYLLDPSNDFKIFEKIPRNFEITTLNTSSKFNIKLIKDVSPVIQEALKKDPKLREYNLKIRDTNNILLKIEQLFQGKFVYFEEIELPNVQKITNLLKITRCPNYMKLNLGANQNFNAQELYLFNGVVMNPNFDFFLANKIPKSFKIITNKKEYKCNIYGIYSSTVLQNILRSQPKCKQYKYDFNDEFDEFQQICNFFNFQKITITPDNMDVLKEISGDLKIDIIYKAVNGFIQKQENVSQTIEDCQNSVDLITELFEWLYGIKKLTVETVKSQIIESIWSKTDDNIIELAAFLLQVVNHDISLHNEMIELITSLNDEMKILTPFLVDKVMSSFGNSINNCSFIYKLFKKGVIQKVELKEKLTDLLEDCEPSTLGFVVSWFLPEMIEFNIFKESRIQNHSNVAFKFVRSFLPDKIDLYKQMRDSEEPNDLITRAIRKDDVDTFQSIITQNHHIKKLSKCFIPYNIFDPFVDEKLTYLNYSAACGSIKCFKYLILNHEQASQKTFNYAILSGNIEIIKIIDQQLAANKDTKKITTSTRKSRIIPLIKTHKNDLFDWIFEQKFTKDDLSNEFINDLVVCSIENGNIHALIEFIDRGYDFISNIKTTEALKLAAKNGFCKLLEFMINIIDKKSKSYLSMNTKLNGYNEYVSFGNLSIYKILLNAKPTSEMIIETISHAIIRNKMNIIDYFFNEQVKNGYMIFPITINAFLNASLCAKSNDLFDYLIENFKKYCSKTFESFEFNMIMLETACSFKKEKEFLKIIELLPKSERNNDFTKCFFNAINSDSIEICKYLIDNKLFTSFDLFLSNSRNLSRKNKEIISLIIGNCDTQLKERLLQSLLRPAIENHNLELVEFLLLKENIFYDDSLISAVNNNDTELVNLFLKYKNDSAFINQGSVNGTPLSIAVKHNNYSIVKLLLSIPSINPNLYDRDNKTPLMRAVDSQNYEIINEFLSFYKNNIFERRDQIDYLLNKIIYININNNNNNNIDVEQYEQINKILEYLMTFDKFMNILDERNYKFLIDICSCEEFTDIIKTLLKFENINFNIYSPSNGDTPLITAIKNKNVGIAELLINDPRTNINLKNFNDQSPLTVAIQKELDTIIESLINNEKLDSKESLLNYAFIISNVKISKILLSKKLVDVNCKFYGDRIQSGYNYYYYNQDKKVLKTALLQAVKKNDIEKIDLIINHPEFDIEKSLLKDSISLSITTNNNNCFKKLINILSIKELNEFKCENKSLSFLLINNNNDEMFEELLQNPEFVVSNDDIVDCVFNLLNINEKSFHFMSLLVEYDKKHNKALDFDHYSFLTGIRVESTRMSSDDLLHEFENILSLFDKNTSNKNFYNLCSTNWIYPFEHAIRIESEEYVKALINTKRIDFNQKLYRGDSFHKFTTYFHIAAGTGNSRILQILIDKKILNLTNVNTVDYNGNTPLMKACKHLLIDNVNILFKIENLRYMSTNKFNYDALQIVQNLLDKDTGVKSKKQIGRIRKFINKDLYLKQLVATIREANGEFYDDDDNNYLYNNDFNNNDDDINDDEEDDDDDVEADTTVTENSIETKSDTKSDTKNSDENKNNDKKSFHSFVSFKGNSKSSAFTPSNKQNESNLSEKTNPQHKFRIGWDHFLNKNNEVDKNQNNKIKPAWGSFYQSKKVESPQKDLSWRDAGKRPFSQSFSNEKTKKKEFNENNKNDSNEKNSNEDNTSHFNFNLSNTSKFNNHSSSSSNEQKTEEKVKTKPIVFEFNDNNKETKYDNDNDNKNIEKIKFENKKDDERFRYEDDDEDDVDDDFDANSLNYFQNDIDQNYSFQQQFYYYSQVNYLTQSLFDLQMDINKEIFKKSNKKSKKKRNKK